MMALRLVSPFDFASLAALQARSVPNQARSREALAMRPAWTVPWLSLATEWLPTRRARHAWVYAGWGMARAVVAIRRRPGPSCWEIDRLHVPRGREQDAPEALEAAARAVSNLGGKRLFLRLSEDSPVAAAVGYTQFDRYMSEELFVGEWRGAMPARGPQGQFSMRPSIPHQN